MLERLKRLRERRQRRKLERLIAENLELSEQLRELMGDEPIELRPEERKRLKALRDRAGPEVFKLLGLGDVFNLDDDDGENKK